MDRVRIATRGSPLARLQADLVATALRERFGALSIEIVVVETVGDRRTDLPIEQLAGRGVFTNEVDGAVAAGRADVAVHSAKDLPATEPPDAPVISAVLARGEVRDCLVGRALADLGAGVLVATGVPRRRVQLASFRPDLLFAPLRGNIATRLDRLPPGGAVVVALAALERLGMTDRIAEVLPSSVVLPQVGQGVIALRTAAGDAMTQAFLEPIDDGATHRCLLAERAFLRALGGGCDAPVGANATLDDDGQQIVLTAMIASGDGHTIVRRSIAGTDPDELGASLAHQMLDHDGASGLVQAGG